MSDQIPTPSPCTGVCKLSPDHGFCLGCLRSGAEIAEWREAGEARRQQILARLDARRAAGLKTVKPKNTVASRG